MTNNNLTNQRIKFPWNTKPQGLVQFKAIIDLIDQPILLVDRQKGTIWGANPAFGKLANWDPKELIGQKVETLFTDIEQIVLPVVENEPAGLIRKSKESIIVNLLARSIEANDKLYLLIASQDSEIDLQRTRRQERMVHSLACLAALSIDGDFDQELQTAAGSMQAAMEVSNLCIYQADSANPRLIKLVEVGDEAVFPESVSSTNLIRLSKTTLWQAGKRMVAEVHHAGRDHQMQFVGSVPLGQSGRLFGLLIVADRHEPGIDLTRSLEVLGAQITQFIENFLFAENLREEISRLQQSLMTAQVIMDNAQEGILVVSPAMDLLKMNPAAEWMLGYADWEAIGKRVENILIGPDGLVPALEAAVKGIPTHNIGTVSLHRRNGQSFSANIQTLPVEIGEEVTALVVLISDTSENEENRIRTQQLEQRAILGEVTAVFAHEVRNPINNIYTGLQLLAAVLPEDDPNQENLVRLQNECVRLNHLMESVLNFSRNTQYKYEAVDLGQLLQRMIERWRPRFSKVNVTPFIHVEENCPLAYADPRAMEQVFTNLVSNATDAMSAQGGNLAIRINPLNSMPNRTQVVVTVSDDGPGIPDEIRERVFEPFLTTKSNGTGLGLAITKRIVTAHHGSIKVNSFPGGTMFEVTLLAYDGENS
jgi:two-component system sensor histidine kinase AtoS